MRRSTEKQTNHPESQIMQDLQDIPIMKCLWKGNANLHKYVISKIEKSIPFLNSICTVFEEYTDHGPKHAYEVLRLGDTLLGQNDLISWEIAIFALACFYHDIGMHCTEDEYNNLENTEAFQREYPYLKETIASNNQLKSTEGAIIERFVKIEYIRRKHGERSKNWILENFPKESAASFFDNVYLWDAISELCIGHCLSTHEIEQRGYDAKHTVTSATSVDLRFLLCLLRLADICHLSRDRALPFMRKGIDFYSKKSLSIWKNYSDVAGVDTDSKRNTIQVTAIPRNFPVHRAIMDCAGDIEKELQLSHKLLVTGNSNYAFQWKFVDTSGIKPQPDADYNFVDARFLLDYHKITELLMGSKLYRDPLFAIRECIQNSLDAIHTYNLKYPDQESYIVLSYHTQDGRAFLDIFDSGTGMDQVMCIEHLLAIGSKSFYASERRYKEWGSGPLSPIASHGIGFLSTFMLADLVEVFSSYLRQPPVHLKIDSITAAIEFLNTDTKNFPSWKNNLLPWEHGTCVRLRLKDELPEITLMTFLAHNILRVGIPLKVVYRNQIVDLNEVWHKTGHTRHDNADLEQLKQFLFNPPPRDRYYNPPDDGGLESGLIQDGNIKFKVQLRYDDAERSRISQNGILISDGERDFDFLLRGTERIQTFLDHYPFSYDINLVGKDCFELDAERCRIIYSSKNKKIALDIEEKLWKVAIDCISKIESSLYFPNGAKYYHGSGDLFAKDDLMQIYFHKALTEWFTQQRIREFHKKYSLEPVLKAKIYNLCSVPHNTPISAYDILEKHFPILIPLMPNCGMPIKRKSSRRENIMEQMCQWMQQQVLTSAKQPISIDQIAFLPGFPDICFSLILSIICDFEFENLNDVALLAKPSPCSRYRFRTKDVLKDKYEQYATKSKKKKY